MKLPVRAFQILRNEGGYEFLKKGIQFVESNTIARSGYYQSVAPFVYNKLGSFEVDEYDAPCDPYKIIWVDPDEIIEVSRRPVPIDRWAFGQVQDGEWDTRGDFMYKDFHDWHAEIYQTKFYDDCIFHQALKDHFNENVPWEDTQFFELALQYIEEGWSLWKGSSSKEELFERADQVDEIYQSIKTRGYKPYHEIETARFPKLRRHEIQIDIGRTGELLFVEGRHRLSIAKILEIEKVPVVVLVRHKKWMEHRNDAYENRCHNHPDYTEW